MATIYRCDQCKYEASRSSLVHKIEVPKANEYGDYRYDEPYELDICVNCRRHLIDYLKTNPTVPQVACHVSDHDIFQKNWHAITDMIDGGDNRGVVRQTWEDQYYLDTIKGLLKLHAEVSVITSVSSTDGSAELGVLQEMFKAIPKVKVDPEIPF
jgi:hypothetical protein